MLVNLVVVDLLYGFDHLLHPIGMALFWLVSVSKCMLLFTDSPQACDNFCLRNSNAPSVGFFNCLPVLLLTQLFMPCNGIGSISPSLRSWEMQSLLNVRLRIALFHMAASLVLTYKCSIYVVCSISFLILNSNWTIWSINLIFFFILSPAPKILCIPLVALFGLPFHCFFNLTLLPDGSADRLRWIFVSDSGGIIFISHGLGGLLLLPFTRYVIPRPSSRGCVLCSVHRSDDLLVWF